MEPKLSDSTDYNKPLSRNKFFMILLGFFVLFGLYGISYLILEKTDMLESASSLLAKPDRNKN